MKHVLMLALVASLPQGRVVDDPRRLEIEFLYLDTSECTRCIDTGTRLDEAVALLRPIMAETGWDAHVTRTHVTSEEQARAIRFGSSPTVRINGNDIQLESRESLCADCGKLCKDASVKCREWRFHDAWFTSPPRGLFLEALMGAMHGDQKPARPAPTAATTPFEVPENLKRFFATKKTAASRPACCAGKASEEKAGCCESRNTSKEGCCAGRGSDDGAPKTAAPAPECLLRAESRADRKSLIAELKRDVVERRELDNGLSFRFKSEPGIVTRLAQIVDLERDCCQFIRFSIRAEEKGGAVWLDLTGSAETKARIQEYFGQD